MKRVTILAALLTLAALTPMLDAHVRLTTQVGYDLRWGQPANISIVVNQTGSDDITDGSHFTAFQNAIRTWNTVPGSAARLVENTSSVQRARTDWGDDRLHLMYFDEDGSSGYLPFGSGIVAITPVWFTASGVISDADVLFNGRDFLFTTSGEPGHFDLQDVATHELGHLLGLDHSGWAGATMYPYVDTTINLHRSLSQDEICGMRAAYPSAEFGMLSGVLRRSNDDIVEGAQIVARGLDGRPYASVLTSNLGAFSLRGLALGDYTLYATPLDAPVSESNLSSSYDVDTNFQTTMFGTFTVLAPEDTIIGNLTVLPDAPLSLGRSSDVFPIRCIAGRSRTLTLHGSGLVPGSSLAASDSSVTVSVFSWGTSQVTLQVTVPAEEPSGNIDLVVTNPSGQRSALVGCIEITPGDPTVTLITPASGSFHGGTPLTINGTNFRRGARVVMGSRIYADGASGGCTVVDQTTITLTTAATESSAVDVVVMDFSGVEGRATAGYRFESQPAIASVFPPAGSAAGGTPVVLLGSDFVPGCTISIDGVVQNGVEFVSSSKLSFTTRPGAPGAPSTVVVTNPMGEQASALFTYSVVADPSISMLDPAVGSVDGGSLVMIHGANFTATSGVFFGADGDTGRGGRIATNVTWIDANTLSVVTPAFSSGVRNVVVLDANSNQAAIAPAAFVYQSSRGGGGGGGCAMGPIGPNSRPFDGGSGFLALAFAFVILFVRSRMQRSARFESA